MLVLEIESGNYILKIPKENAENSGKIQWNNVVDRDGNVTHIEFWLFDADDKPIGKTTIKVLNSD